MIMINADQITTNMNGSTLEIFIDDKLTAKVSGGKQELGFVYGILKGMGYEVNEDNYVQRALTTNEHLYANRQSQQIAMQTGFIGHLQAEFGTTGKQFYTTFHEFNNPLATQEFLIDLDTVLTQLRDEGQMLKDQDAMFDFCNSHADWKLPGDNDHYGLRIDTTKYTYMLRFTPLAVDYNLYCYCYQKECLDHHQAEAKIGIRFIDSYYNTQFTISDGDTIRIVGPQNQFEDKVCRYVDPYHFEMDGNLFHISEFAECMQKLDNTVIPFRNSLPNMCYVYVSSEGCAGTIFKGQQGYIPAAIYGKTPEELKQEINRINEKLGITKRQMEAMKAGSLFGWKTPAADPANYNENGSPIRKKLNFIR